MDDQLRVLGGGGKLAPPKVGRKPKIFAVTEEPMSTPHPYAFDASLVPHVFLGDRGAFTKLVRPHEVTIYKLAWALSSDDSAAEEVAQDSVVRAWREFREFSVRSCFRGWLASRTLNAARVAAGIEPRFEAISEFVPSHFNDWQNIPTSTLEDPRFRAEVHCALTLMPFEYREPFALRDMLGFSAQQCAGILGIEERTAKQALSSARLCFRDELANLLKSRDARYASGGRR